jgi:hypothetical protein
MSDYTGGYGSALLAGQFNPKAFDRYFYYSVGSVVDVGNTYTASDGQVGYTSNSDGISVAVTSQGGLNMQMLPGFPRSIPLIIRNTTLVGAVRSFTSTNGGLMMGGAPGISASETVEARFGGTGTSGRNVWFVRGGTADVDFGFKVRVKNYGGWANGDIFYFGFGKSATATSPETETNFVGFKISWSGVSNGARIYNAYRVASGAWQEDNTGVNIDADGNALLGYRDLLLTLKGSQGGVTAGWYIDGVDKTNNQGFNVANLAAAGYTPQMFWVAAAGATFDGPVIESVEIGPTLQMGVAGL